MGIYAERGLFPLVSVVILEQHLRVLQPAGCCSKPRPELRLASLAVWDYAHYLFCQRKTHTLAHNHLNLPH